MTEPIIPETEFNTNIIFPEASFQQDPRCFRKMFHACYDWNSNQNREKEFMGYVLKRGKKITKSALDRFTDNEEFKRFYANNTILTFSQTTADHRNKDLYENIYAELNKGKLRYAFKDRIPKGKHILAVLVPTRSNPAWKNCLNYDIPYNYPVPMMFGDKGGVQVEVDGLDVVVSMYPLGDAIIVLKN
jgi:hypothetical protein